MLNDNPIVKCERMQLGHLGGNGLSVFMLKEVSNFR